MLRLCAKLGALVGFIVVVATGIQIMIEVESIREEREYRIASRISDERANLYRQISGDSGKGESLSYLYRNEQINGNISLDCETFGLADEAGSCQSEVVLSNVRLDDTEREIEDIVSIRFSGIELRKPKFSNTSLLNLEFHDVTITDGIFDNFRNLSFDYSKSSLACKNCLFVDSIVELAWVSVGSHVVGGEVHATPDDVSRSFGRTTENVEQTNGMLSHSFTLAPKLYPEALPKFVFPEPSVVQATDFVKLFSYCVSDSTGLNDDFRLSQQMSNVDSANIRLLLIQPQICYSFDDLPIPLTVEVFSSFDFSGSPMKITNQVWRNRNTGRN